MKPLTCLPLLAALLLTACVPTLHPFYKKDQTVMRDELAGKWSDGKTTWNFIREDSSYSVTYTAEEEGKSGEFAGHLVELDGRLYLDLYPKQRELPTPGYWNFHLIRAHTFLLVDQIEPALKLRPFNPNWARKHLAENPGAIAHTLAHDLLVFTASTDDLQAFVRKHAATEGAFSNPAEFQRVRENRD